MFLHFRLVSILKKDVARCHDKRIGVEGTGLDADAADAADAATGRPRRPPSIERFLIDIKIERPRHGIGPSAAGHPSSPSSTRKPTKQPPPPKKKVTKKQNTTKPTRAVGSFLSGAGSGCASAICWPQKETILISDDLGPKENALSMIPRSIELSSTSRSSNPRVPRSNRGGTVP